MELFQIRCLAKAVESGSVRAAARALAVSAPTILKAISSLEAEFGGAMLLRSNKGVRPTALGSIVLEHGQLMLDTERRALEAARSCTDVRRQIRIATTEGPAVLLLPDVIAELRSRAAHPLDVRVSAGGYVIHREHLRRGEVDVMISPVPDDFHDTGLRQTPLYRTSAPLIGPAHASASNTLDLRDLAQCTWIVVSPHDKGPGAAILQTFASLGLPPPKDVIRSECHALTVRLIRRLKAYALVPEPLIPTNLAELGLRRYDTVQPLATHAISMLTRHDLIPSADLSLLMHILCKHAARLDREHTGVALSR